MSAAVKITSEKACEALFASQTLIIDDSIIDYSSVLPVTETTWSDYYKETMPNLQAPWWAHRQHNEEAFSGIIWVDKALPYFAGHFPGDPILPGVVQLHWALTAASEVFSSKGLQCFVGMSQIKFKARVDPCSWLKMDLQVSGATVSFTLANADGVCTQARLHYID